jgi:TonB family protein
MRNRTAAAAFFGLMASGFAFSSEWPPATGDYAPYEDTSCRAEAPRIVYPERLRRVGIGGRVLFRVTVDADGRFVGATVEKSSGYRQLDDAGKRVLKHWCFRPGRMDGRPVGGPVLVPVHFHPN